jgi:hypothetical protein
MERLDAVERIGAFNGPGGKGWWALGGGGQSGVGRSNRGGGTTEREGNGEDENAIGRRGGGEATRRGRGRRRRRHRGRGGGQGGEGNHVQNNEGAQHLPSNVQNGRPKEDIDNNKDGEYVLVDFDMAELTVILSGSIPTVL